MTRAWAFPPEAFAFVVAPMVDASDLPFRLMCIQGGATMTYTQMYVPEKLEQDQEYRQRAISDLVYEKALPAELKRPVIVQLGGRDIAKMVEAAKMFAPYCDGIDINCGCPQEPVILAGYGSALLARQEWDHLVNMVRAVIAAIDVPVSVKIRLCTPAEATVELAKRLEAAGVSHIALHARFPSAKHRRHGAAKLEHVQELASALTIPVLSNGNVRCRDDLTANMRTTGAAGLMVGEEVMRNPYLIEGDASDPFDVTNEYLDNCLVYPGSATPKAVRQHIRYFFEQSYLPKAWSHVIKKRLSSCEDLEGMRNITVALKPTLATISDC